MSPEKFGANDYNLNIKVPKKVYFDLEGFVVLTIKDTKQQKKIPFSFTINDGVKLTKDRT